MVTEDRKETGRNEIADARQSGGPNTSHTILLPALSSLLDAVPAAANHDTYRRAVVDDNVLGKATLGSRKRTFRYLRELYLLRPDSVLFSALRLLWPEDERARPLLAGLCALARDPSFRASAPAILEARPGQELSAFDLAAPVQESFPDTYNESTLNKIGRNTYSSWQQTGHLEAAKRNHKVRVDVDCRPSAVAYALMLGALEGAQGTFLFETFWAQVLDRAPGTIMEQARVASQASLIDLRTMGDVVEVGVDALLGAARRAA